MSKLTRVDELQLENLSLSAIDDVSLNNPTSGQVLTYADGVWVNSELIITTALSALDDVSLNNPTSGQMLTYANGVWVNSDVEDEIIDASEEPANPVDGQLWLDNDEVGALPPFIQNTYTTVVSGGSGSVVGDLIGSLTAIADVSSMVLDLSLTPLDSSDSSKIYYVECKIVGAGNVFAGSNLKAEITGGTLVDARGSNMGLGASVPELSITIPAGLAFERGYGITDGAVVMGYILLRWQPSVGWIYKGICAGAGQVGIYLLIEQLTGVYILRENPYDIIGFTHACAVGQFGIGSYIKVYEYNGSFI
jgi:hypothetical protein